MNKPKLIMLCGIPASGKSIYAKELAKEYNAIIYSSDSIRAELLGCESDNSNNELVFNTLYQRATTSVLQGQNIIIDACNINRKDRKRALTHFESKKFDIERICYVVATPYDICVENDKKRDRQVGEEVIRKFLYRFEIPVPNEGFDNTIIVNNENYKQDSITQLVNNCYDFNQNNPHHSLCLIDHLDECSGNANTNKSYLKIACKLHDIGKPMTKTKDTNGVSHYYQHSNVGAYYLMCSDLDNNIIRYVIKQKDYIHHKSYVVNNLDYIKIIFLVNYHMLPYQFKEQKTKDKYKKLFGEELYNDLMLLHEADKLAH